ncbi:MAG: hypothetical protein HQ518_18245 [Rhodopirellula sp.]|nr:hypothetical protein [Rhodopirellula sp.]
MAENPDRKVVYCFSSHSTRPMIPVRQIRVLLAMTVAWKFDTVLLADHAADGSSDKLPPTRHRHVAAAEYCWQ